MSKKQKEHSQDYNNNIEEKLDVNDFNNFIIETPEQPKIERRGRPRTTDPSTTRTDYMREYMRNYYKENKHKHKLKQQSYYFKKQKEMPSEMIDKYGELASTMFSINQLIGVVKSTRPEYLNDINLN